MTRWRPTGSTFLLGAYTVILLLALVAPLEFYPRNAVTWLEHADGIHFTSIGVVRSVSSPTRLYTDLTSGEGLTAEVLLSSHTGRHRGPARILSYSGGASTRNFSLDRKGQGLVVRLRTSLTGRNGTPVLEVHDVFNPGEERHLVVTYDFTQLCLYVDGQRRVCNQAPRGDFRNWDPSHELLLGNEVTGKLPWLGIIARVALYNVPLSAETIERLHAAVLRKNERSAPAVTGGLVALYRFTERSGTTIADSSPRPSILLTIPKRVEKARAFLARDSQLLPSWPLSRYLLLDGVVNLLIFVPFGLLGCIVLAARGWTLPQAIGTTIATTASLSFAAESIQYFLVSRSSELNDLILNVVSGSLGGALYWVTRRLRETA